MLENRATDTQKEVSVATQMDYCFGPRVSIVALFFLLKLRLVAILSFYYQVTRSKKANMYVQYGGTENYDGGKRW